MNYLYKKNVLFLLAALACVFGGISAGIFQSVLRGLPEIKELEDFKPVMATAVYSADDQMICQWYIERRSPVPLSRIPELLKKAVLAVEDKKFFEHEGLDWIGILRAALANIKAGRVVQGGSTITQQLSKVLFLTPERSFNRKAKEAVLALQIERIYTKKEILELYLNQIYYGSGAYGVQSAAQTFFGKDICDLTLSECALIAGIPKAPNLYSPFFHPERALKRRRHVLLRMLQEGIINNNQFKEAVKSSLSVITKKKEATPAPYFIERVRVDIERELGPNLLYRGGLHIYTTLELDAQKMAEQAMREGLAQIEQRRRDSGPSSPDDLPLQGALIAINPKNGYVISEIGGRDFNISQFDRAIQAKRQPGSAFKPIVYASAIQNGFTPADIIIDSPVVYTIPGTEKPWKPKNFGQRFYGPTRLRTALEKSINVVTVKLLEKVGITTVIDFANKLGITSPLLPYPSLALGTFEVSLEELTACYLPFINSGIKVRPIYVRYIKDPKGEVLYESIPEFTQVLTPATAYIMATLLKGAVENGTGKLAQKVGSPVAGKTGTTDNYTDAWFIGFNPDIATGVWVGFDQKICIGNYETGARAACPIWTEFMGAYLAGKPSVWLDKPGEVVVVPIDPENGLRVSESFPNALFEVFQKGTEPAQYSKSEAKDWIGPADFYLRFID